MDTQKLYYENPYLAEFEATVLSCSPLGERFEVSLSQTAFYPEGGGQPGDTGTLGTARVLDTYERDGEILQLCDAALSVGRAVFGKIDFARRLDLMQNHSGEHILSGIVFSRFGFKNVGFHMGAEVITIDFDGEIPESALSGLEREANEAVWKNIPFKTSAPGAAELKDLFYRSKKELSGEVRIVTCEGYDACACCGTHVLRSGEIGLIKILSCKRLRGGARLEIVCGARAYEYVNLILAQNGSTSVLLSAAPEATFAAVRRQFDELCDARYRLYGFEDARRSALADSFSGVGEVLLFEPSMPADDLRRLCERIFSVCGGDCRVFSGADGEGYKYAIKTTSGEGREEISHMNDKLSGRGGGRDGFFQGALQCERTELEAFFARR